MFQNRYVYDALYGLIRFPPYVWKVMFCPELQRLREVRLCNINSLSLTGGANINRYEHSLGTAYLALICLERFQPAVDEQTKRRIVLAALLHDVVSAPFGHSIQYVWDRIEFKHDSALYDMLAKRPTDQTPPGISLRQSVEPIYFGLKGKLLELISDEELKAVSNLIAGRGRYGLLINGSIDLDNIDNVYRLAYHIGLVDSGRVPLKLARSLGFRNNKLVVNEDATSLVEDWYKVRRRLYHYLLLNPDEFSGKCMLEHALETEPDFAGALSISWHDVDFEVLQKLSVGSFAHHPIIARLMTGDLYGCVGIYSTSRTELYGKLRNVTWRRRLEAHLRDEIRKLSTSKLKNADIAIHSILDENKTQRQIRVLTNSGRVKQIGTPTHQVLLGVFFKDRQLGMSRIGEEDLRKWRVREKVFRCLRNKLDRRLTELALFGEAADDST